MSVPGDTSDGAGRVLPLLTAQERHRVALVRGLIASRAQRLGRRYAGLVDRDDLETAGKTAVLEIVRQYDETRDAAFASYAIARIDGRMLQLVGAETQAKCVEKAMAVASARVKAHFRGEYSLLNETPEALLGKLDELAGHVAATAISGGLVEATEDEGIGHADYAGAMRWLAEAMTALTHDEALVIAAVFADDMSLKDIEREAGIPYITVRRRFDRALPKLRKALEKRGMRGPIASRDVPSLASVLRSVRDALGKR